MNIPNELKYTKTHEWVKIQDDIAIQGITDFAQSELSDIAFVELPEINTKLEIGTPCGTIEAVKAVSDMYASLSGEVIEINKAIVDDPTIINSDPYGEGWFIKIKLSNKDEINNLMNADEYKKFLEENH